MKTKARKIIRALVFSLLLGVFCFAFLVAILWVRMNRDDRLARVEIQKRLDAIRAAGEPLTAEDMARLYPDPPPEHDAALLLRPALAVIVVPKDSTNLPFFGGFWPNGSAPIPKSMLTEIQALMAKNQKSFDAVPLEQLQGAWIGCSYQNGFSNMVYAPLTQINDQAKLLCVNAAFEAESQHSSEAARSLLKVLAIGNSWRNDVMIHGLVRIGTEERVCCALNRVLNRTQLTDSDLAAISEGLLSTNRGAYTECLINERCSDLFHVSVFQTLAARTKSYSFSPGQWLIRAYQSRLIYRDQDLLNYLEAYDRSIAMAALPLSNAIPMAQVTKHDPQIFPKEKPAKYFAIFFNTFKKDRFSFLSMLVPGINWYFKTDARLVTEIRATRVAIAVERWRLAHGDSVPDSLAELVPDLLPAIPNDPFDEQPMRYKKLDRGYVVYSIGEDFTDDDGRERPNDAKDTDHYDITFRMDR